METKNWGAHAYERTRKPSKQNNKKKKSCHNMDTRRHGTGMAIILSPRCKPGSLAHLFRSFAKQAFSAGILVFFSPLCSFTLGTVSQAQGQSVLFDNN